MEQERSYRFSALEILSLSILLSVAAFFRFYLLNEKLVFQGDQGRALLAARDILQGNLLLLGPETSVAGFHLGPFFYYLIAPALWLADYSPLGPAILTASFGVATVLLLFFFGRRFFSFPSGLAMGLLYAVSPHAIWQSRIALEPSPLPFFSILWLYAIGSWWQEKKLAWLVVAGISIFLGVQCNFSAIVLLPATLWLALFRIRLPYPWKRRLVFAFLGELIGLLILRVLFFEVTPWEYFVEIWRQLTIPTWPVFAIPLFIAFCMLGANLFGRTKSTHSLQLVIGSWLVFSLVGFIFKFVSGEHAMALLFPAPAVLGGGLLYLALQKRTDIQRAALAITSILLLLLSWQALQYLEQKNSTFLSEHETTVDHILTLAENKPYRFSYRGHLDIYPAADDHYQYLLWWKGNAPNESAKREIILYHPPFNFSEYELQTEPQEWNGLWFEVRGE